MGTKATGVDEPEPVLLDGIRGDNIRGARPGKRAISLALTSSR
jgi:hypothetical protein